MQCGEGVIFSGIFHSVAPGLKPNDPLQRLLGRERSWVSLVAMYGIVPW